MLLTQPVDKNNTPRGKQLALKLMISPSKGSSSWSDSDDADYDQELALREMVMFQVVDCSDLVRRAGHLLCRQ